jgi:16S rRNA processing protein RimM
MQQDEKCSEWIAVGRIVRSIGIRGEVKIIPLTDDERRMEGVEVVFLGKDEVSVHSQRIESAHLTTRAWKVKFFGVDRIEAAEKLRGLFLFLPRKNEPRMKSGSFRIDDIIGCEMFTGVGRRVGQVSDVLVLPANDVWVVRDGEKEYLFPAVRALISKVDVEAKRIEVHELEGLFE